MTDGNDKVATRYAVVCGIDPGKTTGVFFAKVSVAETPDDQLVKAEVSAYECETSECVDVITEIFDDYPYVSVGIEQFIITQNTGKLTQQPDALHFIGIIKDICRLRNINVHEQMKSNVEKMGNNTVLKRIGWYFPGMDHATDAARHALFALSGANPIIFSSLINPNSTID